MGIGHRVPVDGFRNASVAECNASRRDGTGSTRAGDPQAGLRDTEGWETKEVE